MVLYKVYSQEYRIRYFAHPCSTAVLFQIACLLFTFLPPLFTGYFTSGFYYKELSYSEQPNVTFLQRYNLIISSPSTLIFSSSETILNNYFLSSYSPTILGSSIPRDVNGDGIVDQQTITINITASSTISTQVIDLWLIFQYALNQYPLVNMETLGLISLNAPSSISNYQAVTIYGQLVFQQRAPVLSYENVSALQGPIIDYGNYSVVPSFDDILNNYRARNYSTTFNVQYVQWSPSTSTTNTQLTIKVVVNTGSQVIRYVPSFWKVFRWAWIQYIAGLLPFFYVMNKIKEFVFSNGLVRTVIKKSP
jgi:hypothetical protein